MIVEFLVACFLTPGPDVKQAIIDLLASVLLVYGNDFEESAIAEMVILRHRRVGNETEDDGGTARQYTIIGFAIELPEETEVPDDVIEEFAGGLADTEHGFHVLRFEDPMLQARLAEYSDEIFSLEMKLRRVLSIVYLHTYQDNEYAYNLLKDEKVNPMNNPNQEQMQTAVENEFFHLTFSQYINLNDRKAPTRVTDVISLIQNTENYDALLENLHPHTIVNSGDAELLADIEKILDPIESMRNCVAHYRRPSGRITANYHNARNELNERLDNYLAEWEI